MRSLDDLAKLYIYRDKLAELVIHNESFSPVFLRVEQEIASLEEEKAAHDAQNVVARARAIASRQKAMV
ncbi:hypothetical protein [Rhodobacter viridis]|uniref:hypothetical protein n=1 Tax=Rhodobacter viridis TaxID=1054202 RepID=UPI000DA1631F|nr:hypothetical protein [Rhodobacter viridis]